MIVLDHFIARKSQRLRMYLLLTSLFASSPALFASGRFSIEQGKFFLDGKQFQIISGEMHYARIPEEYWRDRLMKARAMGLNTVATYVFWNFHEPKEGEYNFKGRADVAKFVKMAQDAGLFVILRPGPYACAEWDFGGYPSWLLKDHDLKVRSQDAKFLSACERYLNALGRELKGLQISKGGPIIMVQVENEYGSYGKDTIYEGKIRDMIRNAGFDVPLFTADGPSQCRNAHLAGVLPAINGDDNPQSIVDTVNEWNNGQGPYFSPEFYPGWLDHWGEAHSVSPVGEFIGRYDTLLMKGISVSLYMVHGGTNFGFMNGANYGGHYQPQPTSYDYDAPIDEAGRTTPKYFRFRETLSKYVSSGARIPDVPHSPPTIAIPPFVLNESSSVLANLPASIHAEKPLSMEDVGQSYGYINYRTVINSPASGILAISGLRDYGVILLNGKKIASLDRRDKQSKVNLDVTRVPATLDIFVENGGRVNYGREMLDNRKGITGSVTLNGNEITGWEMYPFPLDEISRVRYPSGDDASGPKFFRGAFLIDTIGDTFLDMRGWSKGCVWVNGYNLGRFWYIGPQQTLYLPGVWLKKGENQIVVLDLENRTTNSIAGLKDPVLGQLEPDRLKPPPPDRLSGKANLETEDLVMNGSFSNVAGPQDFAFAPVSGRYVCLQSLSSQRNDPFASIAEFYVMDDKGKIFARDKWKVYSVDCEETDAEDGHAENAFDDDPESIWHTTWGSSKPGHPHYLAIDLGDSYRIGGFRYVARMENAPGKIREFRFYVRMKPFELSK